MKYQMNCRTKFPAFDSTEHKTRRNCFETRQDMTKLYHYMGPELFWEWFVFHFFKKTIFSARFPCYLQHFGAGNCQFNCLCNILELEPLICHRICNILVEFVSFWSWKLPFQRYLQHCWVRTFHFWWNLQHFVARTVHVTWWFATRVHLGLVLRCFTVSLGVLFGFKFLKGWF